MTHIDPSHKEIVDRSSCNEAARSLSNKNVKILHAIDPALRPILETVELSEEKRLLKKIVALQKDKDAIKVPEFFQLDIGRGLSIGSPLLIDQLVIFEGVIHSFDESTREKLVELARTWTSPCRNCFDIDPVHDHDPCVTKALKLVGILTFLCHFSPKFITEQLDSLDSETILSFFLSHLAKEKRRLDKIKTLLIKSKMHLFGNFEMKHFSVMISKMLITNSGCFNIGLAVYFQEEDVFSSICHFPIVKKRLKEIIYSPEIREEIHNIKIGNKYDREIKTIIRSALNYWKKVKLTDRHAKITALSAAITHIRQKPAHACFAHVICSSQLSSNLLQVFKDFSELFLTKQLSREGFKKSYPFILAINPTTLNKGMMINSDGKINDSDVYLWDLPGLRCACFTLGYASPKNALRRFCSKTITRTTPREIIMRLARKESSLRRAFFMYETQNTNPLFTIWCNAIGGMAEGSLSGNVMTNSLRSVAYSLEVSYRGLPVDKLFLVKHLNIELFRLLSEKIQFLYDPELLSKSSDETTGGFKMFVTKKKENKVIRKKIDSAADFQNLIAETILEGYKNLIHKKYSSANKLWLKKIALHLENYIRSDLFLTQILNYYYQANLQYNNPKLLLDQLSGSPWRQTGGNDTKLTLEIYSGQKRVNDFITLEPNNPAHLFEEISKKIKPLTLKKPHLLDEHIFIPARIENFHAFSLILGHPSMRFLQDPEVNIDNWLKENLIKPGIAASNWIPDKNFWSQIESKLYSEFFINSTLSLSGLQKKLSLFLYRGLSYALSRQGLVEMIHEYDNIRDPAKIITTLDTLLFSCLPQDLKNKILKHSLHIADTNWSEDNKDIHLCCFFNPGSGKLELWKASEDYGFITAIDQMKWLHHKWEVFPIS